MQIKKSLSGLVVAVLALSSLLAISPASASSDVNVGQQRLTFNKGKFFSFSSGLGSLIQQTQGQDINAEDLGDDARLNDYIIYYDVFGTTDAVLTVTRFQDMDGRTQGTDAVEEIDESNDEGAGDGDNRWINTDISSRHNTGDSWVEYRLEFFADADASPRVPVHLTNFMMNTYDIDTDQYLEIGGFSTYSIASNSDLRPSIVENRTRFIGTASATLSEPKARVQVDFARASSAVFRLGQLTTSGTPSASFYLDFSSGPTWTPAAAVENPVITAANRTGALNITFPQGSSKFIQGSWQSVATVTGVTPGVSGGTSPTVRATLTAGTNGLLRLGTTTSITASAGYTLTNFNSSSSGLATISFEGSVANVNAALASLQFQRSTNDGTNTITLEVTDGTGLIYQTNYYEAFTVPAGIQWDEAFQRAASMRVESTVAGKFCQGYLATITSAAENTFIFSKVNVDAWLGGSDQYQYVNEAINFSTDTFDGQGSTVNSDPTKSEGRYYWVTGPERGTQFSVGNGSPTAVSSRYINWNNSEPNNASSSEHYLQLQRSTGTWNDLPLNTPNVKTYIVEFGGVEATSSFRSNYQDVTFTDAAEMGTVTACQPAVTANSRTASFTATSAAFKTVTFDANGGSGSMTVQRDSTSSFLQANAFSRTGFTFAGWDTAADGSGTDYANLASYNFAADVTLYAQWNAVPVSAPAKPYEGPLNLSHSGSICSGSDAVVTGQRLNTIEAVYVGDKLVPHTLLPDGRLSYSLKDIPAGNYTVKFWVPVNSINLSDQIRVGSCSTSPAATTPGTFTATKLFANYRGDRGPVVARDLAAITAFIKQYPGITNVTCVGSTSGVPAKRTDPALATARAKNACDAIQKLVPNAKITLATSTGKGVGQRFRSVTVTVSGTR